MEELGISTDMLPPNSVRSRISAAKNALVSVERFTAQQTDFAGERIAQIYALYEKKLAASGALDFDDLIGRSVRLLSSQRAGRRRGAPAPPAPPDRRVPGHELLAGRARQAPRSRVRVPLRGRRRGPVHLSLAGRRDRAHPPLRGGLPGRAGHRPRGELSFDRADPGRRFGRRLAQPPAAREAPPGRPGRRRLRPSLALRGGPDRDRGRGPRDRRGAPAGRGRDPLPHQRPVAALRGGDGPPAASPTSSSAE